MFFDPNPDLVPITYPRIVPIIIVFTKYDELVSSHEMAIYQDNPDLSLEEPEPEALENLEAEGRNQAAASFEMVKSELFQKLGRIDIPCTYTSGEPGCIFRERLQLTNRVVI